MDASVLADPAAHVYVLKGAGCNEANGVYTYVVADPAKEHKHSTRPTFIHANRSRVTWDKAFGAWFVKGAGGGRLYKNRSESEMPPMAGWDWSFPEKCGRPTHPAPTAS